MAGDHADKFIIVSKRPHDVVPVKKAIYSFIRAFEIKDL